MSRNAAAKRFGVSIASAVRWVARFKAKGEVSPAPTGGDRRSGRIEAHRDYLLGLIRRRPDMTLLEIQERLIANCGERFSSSVLWRFFDRHEMGEGRQVSMEGQPAPDDGVVAFDERPQNGRRQRCCALDDDAPHGCVGLDEKIAHLPGPLLFVDVDQGLELAQMVGVAAPLSLFAAQCKALHFGVDLQKRYSWRAACVHASTKLSYGDQRHAVASNPSVTPQAFPLSDVKTRSSMEASMVDTLGLPAAISGPNTSALGLVIAPTHDFELHFGKDRYVRVHGWRGLLALALSLITVMISSNPTGPLIAFRLDSDHAPTCQAAYAHRPRAPSIGATSAGVERERLLAPSLWQETDMSKEIRKAVSYLRTPGELARLISSGGAAMAPVNHGDLLLLTTSTTRTLPM